MDNITAENLTSLLELPGLSNLVKCYTKPSIKVDNTFLNRKQFQSMKHQNTSIVFSYGDLVLVDPIQMFDGSKIRRFTSKGLVYLIGNTTFMFDSTVVFNSDLSRWDVSNVNFMTGMFLGAENFNSDLSRWDVSNVNVMTGMFGAAKSERSSAFNSDLSRWNVSNVTNMSYMFADAKTFNSDLSRWDVGNVEKTTYMFWNATSFSSDLSRWNVEKVKNMESMFKYATSFSSDLSRWNVEKVGTRYISFIKKAHSFDPKLSPFYEPLLTFSSSSDSDE